MTTDEIMVLADAWRVSYASNAQCDDASLAYVENKRLALQSAIEALQADAQRMEFLDRHCSVSFVFKRPDGSTGSLHGPQDIRAAIDAAMALDKP